MSMIKTKALIEQHIHGAYGVDFLNCSVDDLLDCAKRLKEYGVCAFLPTLATAPIEVLKKQVLFIKSAMEMQNRESYGAKILGVNLEACFISPQKNGIHDNSQLLDLNVDNFKLIEDEIIKLVTIAPELDKNNTFSLYLKTKGIKVFAGHTEAYNLDSVDGVTHLFNAMSGIHHREKNTVTSALISDNLYCELIADGFHVDYDNVKLALKCKPKDKIILISDALPIAGSPLQTMEFCSKQIYLKDGRAVDAKGVLAGSSLLLSDIVKKLVQNNVVSLQDACLMSSNSENLFGVEFQEFIVWDENLNIVDYIEK